MYRPTPTWGEFLLNWRMWSAVATMAWLGFIVRRRLIRAPEPGRVPRCRRTGHSPCAVARRALLEPWQPRRQRCSNLCRDTGFQCTVLYRRWLAHGRGSSSVEASPRYNGAP